MEARAITIVNSKTQKKSVVMSTAETLEDLKSDLRAAEIDYEGMTFFEGTSKTEMRDDNSQLPKDVKYKGQITNNLAFMLSQPDKKISSGTLTRVECYAIIKQHNLGVGIKQKYNKNFTVCKTTELIDFINKSLKSDEISSSVNTPTPTPIAVKEPAVKINKVTSSAAIVNGPVDSEDTVINKKFSQILSKLEAIENTMENMIKILYNNGCIDNEEKNSIMSELNSIPTIDTDHITGDDAVKEEESIGGYSKDDLDEMFG